MVNDQMFSSTRQPHFFKVFLPNLNEERLKIPDYFFKHLEGKTSGIVSLTGPSGNTWHVELVKSKNSLFFEEGWSAFTRDHSLQIGDFFVFRYDGNLHFNVLIFDKSACEKESAFCAKYNQDATGFSVVKGKKRATKAENEVLNPSLCRASKRRKENSSQVHSNGQNLPFLEVNKVVDIKKERITQKGMQETSSDVSLVGRLSRKPNSWNAPGIFSSNFPCFVKCMTEYNVFHHLNLPSHFSMAHFQRYNTEIILRSTEGGSWMVHIIYGTKNHRFVGGWRAFVLGNEINCGDTLVFELVNKFEMSVKIFRSVEQ